MADNDKRTPSAGQAPDLDAQAVLGWATVRTGLQLLIGGAFLLLAAGFIWLMLRRAENRSSVWLGLGLLILFGWSLVLIVTGGCMARSVPRRIGLRQRAVAFLIGLGLFTVLGLAQIVVVVEITKGDPTLQGRGTAARLFQKSAEPERDSDAAGKKKLPPHAGDREHMARMEKAMRIISRALLLVLLLTEVSYFLFLSGASAYFRSEPLARGSFRGLMLGFVLLAGAVGAAGWLGTPALLDPSEWDEKYIERAWWASAFLGLVLVVMAGRAHQLITEQLLRR